MILLFFQIKTIVEDIFLLKNVDNNKKLVLMYK